MAAEGFDWKNDGSDFTYGERLAHYQKQFGMHDLPIDRRPAINAVAHELATEEMLTEIHAMLRSLCKAHADQDRSASMPDVIFAWPSDVTPHGETALSGSWAQTRYPDEAERYVRQDRSDD